MILAMSSPVFARMLYGPMAERKFPVSIEDIHPDDFESLLQYVYTGNVRLDSLDETLRVSYAAEKYMLPGLVKLCVDTCWNYLCPKTACYIYEFAKFFDEVELAKQCLNIISLDTKEVLGDPSFLKIKASTVETILDMDELSVTSEMELVKALNEWAHEECQRKGSTFSLRSVVSTALSKLRFLTLTPQDIIDGVAKTDLLTDLENYAIVSNIISPNSTNASMPPNFSTNRTKRRDRPLVSITTDKYSWIQNMKTTEEFDGNLFITSVIFEVRKKMKIVGVQVAKRTNNVFYIHAGEANVVISIDIAIDGGKPISNSYLKEMKTWEKETFETNFSESVYLERNNVYVLKTILHHPRLRELLVNSRGISQQGVERNQQVFVYSSVPVTSATGFAFGNNFGTPSVFGGPSVFGTPSISVAAPKVLLPLPPTKMETKPSILEQPHFVFREQDNIKLRMFV